MSQPIFPKGTKVVKGKVVQRLQGSSQVKEQKLKYRKAAEDTVIMDAGADAGMREDYKATDPEFNKAVMRLIQEGRTGPRLAPGQASKLKSAQLFDDSEVRLLEDPRLERELPKNKPGRIDQNYGPDEDGYTEPSRMIDLEHRSRHPEVEGRGASPLSKIVQFMVGKKMPTTLLKQLKGLDPAKLDKILKILQDSEFPPLSAMSTGESNVQRRSPKKTIKSKNKKYDTDIPF